MLHSITIQTRPRYAEADPMGFVHHSVYPIYFEMARTELLRQSGHAYAAIEKAGIFIVVVKININFHRPARYDEELDITAQLVRSAGARIEHNYLIARNKEKLVTGSTTLACIDPSGKPLPVPDQLYYDPA